MKFTLQRNAARLVCELTDESTLTIEELLTFKKNLMSLRTVSIKSRADEEVFFSKPSFFNEEGLEKKIIVHK